MGQPQRLFLRLLLICGRVRKAEAVPDEGVASQQEARSLDLHARAQGLRQ